MAVDNVQLTFNNEFEGTMQSPTGELMIGNVENGFRPYHLLFGALGSCFYATFITIVKKKRLSFDGADIEISGIKREEVPPTLEYAKIKFTIKNPSNEAQFRKSAELAAKHCSIHETISKVARIELELIFE
jgi:putative redox protein